MERKEFGITQTAFCFLFLLKLAIIGNNLSYQAFRSELLKFRIFSLQDIWKVFPTFDSKRLNEWQRKGYIQKLINKRYLFTEVSKSELLQFRISNLLLQPSYVSLESALGYYDFIPEAVFTTVAVSTAKTISYETPAGSFTYHSIKPAIFFGYTILRLEQLPILMAEPEKAILDFLYLKSTLNTVEDFEAMRFNGDAITEKLDLQKLNTYIKIIESPTLSKRLKIFKKFLLHVTS